MTNEQLTAITNDIMCRKLRHEKTIKSHHNPDSCFRFSSETELIKHKDSIAYYGRLLDSVGILIGLTESQRIPLVSLIGEHYNMIGEMN